MPRKPRESIAQGILPIGTEIGDGSTIITYSELDTFRQCPLKHRWAYDLLMTKEQGVGSPLAKGSLWHAAMETYYYERALGKNVEAAHNLAWTRHLLATNGEYISSDAELIKWMLDGYTEFYGRDDDWEILAVELSGMTPLGGVYGDSVPNSQAKIWLQYKIDLLVREISTGRIWIVDHKTASAFSQQVEIDLDDQFGLYTWALRQAGIKVFGFIRSDARTQRNKGPMKLEDRFRRVPTHRSEIELENIRVDALETARVMRQERGPRSAPDPRQCGWKCDFLQAHLMFRKTGRVKRTEVDILEGFGFEPRTLRHREYEATYPPLP